MGFGMFRLSEDAEARSTDGQVSARACGASRSTGVAKDGAGRNAHGLFKMVRVAGLVACMAALCVFCLGACASQGAGGTAASGKTISVSVTVDASSAGQGVFADIVADLPEGATVYDALCATELPFSGDEDYVRGINGLSENYEGAAAGWCFYVNDETIWTPAGECALSDGDAVRWEYMIM